uniref:Uncharacterized protein n=1 Tax=Aegilops tauschii subsp. strangulata TaxID=200361 RepID=A0A453MQX0_AEGTS
MAPKSNATRKAVIFVVLMIVASTLSSSSCYARTSNNISSCFVNVLPNYYFFSSQVLIGYLHLYSNHCTCLVNKNRHYFPLHTYINSILFFVHVGTYMDHGLNLQLKMERIFHASIRKSAKIVARPYAA